MYISDQEIWNFVYDLPTNENPDSPAYGNISVSHDELLETLTEWLRRKRSDEDYKYFVNGKEVSKQDYVAAERRNGFRNTMGMPDEPATSSWSNSKTGDSGRTVYARPGK